MFFLLILVIPLATLTPLQAASNSLVVSRTSNETDQVFRMSIPSDFPIKEDFQVTWSYEIKYITTEGYVGTFDLPQSLRKIDLKSAELLCYLPLNGKYEIRLQAKVKNGSKNTDFEFTEEFTVNRINGFNITNIPNDVIPSVLFPESTQGNELIQLKFGADSSKAGDNFINGHRIGDYAKIVIFRKGRIHTETKYDLCEQEYIECVNDSVPGFSLLNLKKSFYASHRIFYSSRWTIVINRPDWDSRTFVYGFDNKQEIKISDWESSRSSAPDALGATAGLKCPYSFKGSVLSCTITPENEFRNAKFNPIWVDVKVFADGIEQKNLTRQIKTRIGNTSSLKFKLPSSYKELDIKATTLGIEGVTQNQSWESKKPLTSEERQRSYKAGYNSIMYSSQSDLESVNFYGSVTGANGKVIRLKALSWCKNIIFNQFSRGVQIKSSDDWIRGCTDAAMKL